MRRNDWPYDDYGLTGQKVIVTAKSGCDYQGTRCWADVGDVPMKVIKEYPRYILMEVQPHMNPEGFAMSGKYRTCINKADLYTGAIRINHKRIIDSHMLRTWYPEED